MELTQDHKPTNPEERARIQNSRGRVERLVDGAGAPIGPYRVWLEYAWWVAVGEGGRHHCCTATLTQAWSRDSRSDAAGYGAAVRGIRGVAAGIAAHTCIDD